MKKRKSKLERKKRKHDNLINDYDNQKSKHLEKLATKMLEDQDKLRILRDKKSDGKFLDLF
jgi:hypothetical protein|tara:strand:- start:1814 stop:1996 length:183 start_codon:yes stop_codon:yes gene_type:complete